MIENAPSRGKSTAEVHERIRGAILKGALAPGTVVSQVEIARWIGASRTSVRQALRMLETEGLVEAQAGKRLRIAPVSAAEVEELAAMLILNEIAALRLSIPRYRPDDIAALEGNLAVMNYYTIEGDHERWGAIHDAFHRGLTSKAGKRFTDLLTSLADHANRHRRLYLTENALFEAADHDHRRILDACKARDEPAAAELLAKHIAGNALKVIAAVDPDYNPLKLHRSIAIASPPLAN